MNTGIVTLEGEVVGTAIAASRDVLDALIAERLKNDPQAFIGVVEGSLCKSKASTLRRIAEALSFPDYFGHNWDALDECLRDLDQWLPATSHTLVLADANLLLARDSATFRTLLGCLAFVTNGGGTRQPFHTFLHSGAASAQEFRERLQELGAAIDVIP